MIVSSGFGFARVFVHSFFLQSLAIIFGAMVKKYLLTLIEDVFMYCYWKWNSIIKNIQKKISKKYLRMDSIFVSL